MFSEEDRNQDVVSSGEKVRKFPYVVGRARDGDLGDLPLLEDEVDLVLVGPSLVEGGKNEGLVAVNILDVERDVGRAGLGVRAKRKVRQAKTGLKAERYRKTEEINFNFEEEERKNKLKKKKKKERKKERKKVGGRQRGRLFDFIYSFVFTPGAQDPSCR